ncbi:prepilin-type N-terminal cleavage/methylation domain-containing protein [Roseateles sp. SL47]|uniref:prepilin-type N-terminal cleavage/methylation domain-containing protein n=1 Tax=Roseateles sp. SL47 TaxID=2995138 RepID=UPI0022709415|nr:GspH/FimT family pseudopilin [Roseateles sp. SL47]WAC71832.1 prepilin-type N-terminal cleavage/methylation domain-containing protein [Roseateles sp. SL47]
MTPPHTTLLRRCNTRPTCHGFTLLETLVVVALLAALLAFVLPAGIQWQQRQRLWHAAEQVLSDLYLARGEALHGARNIIFRIIPSAAGSCYVVFSGPVNGCSCSVEGPPSCGGDARPLKTAQWPHRSGFPMLITNVPSMLFSGRQGTVALAATLRISIEDVGEVRHVVGITGRIRSCSAGKSFMRWAACEGAGS